MSSTLDIRRRIKSVKNTRQITRAMEKISAIKMRKAQAAAVQSRRYAALAWEMMRALEGNVEKNAHPLLKERAVKRAGFLVVSPDKGLCGSLPSRLLQKIVAAAPGGVASQDARWYTIGKKSREALVRLGAHLEADFGATPALVQAAHSMSVIGTVVSDYLAGKIDALYLCYTDFVNTLVQKATVRHILPFNVADVEPELHRGKKPRFEYAFEPSPEEVLRHLLTRIL
ncbi:F0F1 ATP synthase subunit gamma [Candidatus Azambacteria bacterium]|nr:F0F1 ATP synthase subunit gamma [Candidatus Azambacteria bacterium]